MTVYLDNNIIVSVEDGEFSIQALKNLLSDPKMRFFYSSAHVFEAESYPSILPEVKNEFLLTRFNTLRSISKNNYLYLELKENFITHIIEDPKEVYETITQIPEGIQSLKAIVNSYNFSKEQKEEFRNTLGIVPSKLNNYSETEVIEHLNTKLTIWGKKQSFLEMIEDGIQMHPDGKNFGLHNRIGGVFELLDFFGYWKDKETDTSNYARTWDASHTFFASYCDYFVTDDKRTRYKAKVAYNIYNKRTKIISSRGDL